MKHDPGDDLLGLALAISDGTALSADETGGAERNRHLCEIESIAAFHRALESGSAVRRFGRFELLESLGCGSRGEVWRAWDPDLKRRVAVKLLRPDRSGRPELPPELLREGELIARVHHENVVQIHSVERHEGAIGLVMELIEGVTLEDWLRQHGPMSPQETALIGESLCAALSALHGAGLLHRDIKAQNVMREIGGRIVLMDFSSGLARSGEGTQGRVEVSSGTPLYMAPEALNESPATRSTDIYALGVLLFHLSTGRFPVEAEDLGALIHAHLTRKRTFLRDVRADAPSAFVETVEAALEHEPLRRPQTAGEMETKLHAVFGRRSPATNSSALPVRSRARVLIGWSVLGIAAAAGLFFLALNWLAPGPKEFHVDVRLNRTRLGIIETIQDSDVFHLGDELSIVYRADVPTWLYVIDEDENGNLFNLHPARTGSTAALEPNTKHDIPKDPNGNPTKWVLDLAGGREHLLLIASSARLIELEADLLKLDVPGEPRSTSPSSERMTAVRKRLRGFGTLAPAAAPLPSESSGAAPREFVADTYERFRTGRAAARGVWSRRIVFDGPPRAR